MRVKGGVGHVLVGEEVLLFCLLLLGERVLVRLVFLLLCGERVKVRLFFLH